MSRIDNTRQSKRVNEPVLPIEPSRELGVTTIEVQSSNRMRRVKGKPGQPDFYVPTKRRRMQVHEEWRPVGRVGLGNRPQVPGWHAVITPEKRVRMK